MRHLFIRLAAMVWLACLSTATIAAPPGAPPPEEAPASPSASEVKLDERTYDAIVFAAADRAESRLGSLQNWYWFLATMVGALLVGIGGYFGVNQVRNLRDSVGDEVIAKLMRDDLFMDRVSSKIEESVLDKVQKTEAKVIRLFDFISLKELAKKIDEADSVGRPEREAVLGILERLQDGEDVVQRDEFNTALKQIYTSFFQANVHEGLDTLDRRFRAKIMADSAMSRSGLQHYGYRLLGEVDVTEENVGNMLRYVEACKALDYREAAYPFELAYLLQFKPDNWERRVVIIFEDAETLTDVEKRSFVDRMQSFSTTGGLGKNPTPYVRRIAGKFAAAAEAYQADLQALVADLPPPPEVS